MSQHRPPDHVTPPTVPPPKPSDLSGEDRAALLGEIQRLRGSAQIVMRTADRLAAGVDHMVKVGLVNSRSVAADALLDYDSDGLDLHREALGIGPREGKLHS